jgi:hypothetical protein
MKIIVILFLLILLIYLYSKTKENFDYETKCLNCDNKSYFQCRNCEDCGVCVTEFGDMYCTKGDKYGSHERNDCYKWYYGNIYPQYYYRYYDGSLLKFNQDPRFYPYLKYIDDTKGTNYFSKDYLNNFYKNFNYTMKENLYRR